MSQPLAVTPYFDYWSPTVHTAMRVERFGTWLGKVQLVATRAEGQRLTEGDYVYLWNRRGSTGTLMMAVVCGSWDYSAGAWVRFLMHSVARDQETFYLLCPAPWGLIPHPFRDAFVYPRLDNPRYLIPVHPRWGDSAYTRGNPGLMTRQLPDGRKVSLGVVV